MSVECVSVSVCQWSVSVCQWSVSTVGTWSMVYGLRVREGLGSRNCAGSLSPFQHYYMYIYIYKEFRVF